MRWDGEGEKWSLKNSNRRDLKFEAEEGIIGHSGMSRWVWWI